MGITINKVKISILMFMYADNIVLVSQTGEGLQNGLDILYKYCQTKFNKLVVKVNKSKAMYFAKGIKTNLPVLYYNEE